MSTRPIAPILLLTFGAAESLRALYHGMEHLVVGAGVPATCALTATVNCAAVWSSQFAALVHQRLGEPVAALGLVWGLTAFTAAAVLGHRLLAGKPPVAVAVGAVRF